MVLAELAPTPAIGSAAGKSAPSEPLDGRQWGETVSALLTLALDDAFDDGLACLLDGLRQRRQPSIRRRPHAMREPGDRSQKLR